MNRDDLLNSLTKTYAQCIEIVKKKNADYATGADPFANFRLSEMVGVPAERGILIRICDKLSRISNLLEKEPDVVEESIEDSINDAINYLAILKGYLESKSLPIGTTPQERV